MDMDSGHSGDSGTGYRAPPLTPLPKHYEHEYGYESMHTLLPTQSHVYDHDIVDEESREKEPRSRGVCNHRAPTTHSYYHHQGKAAVIYEDPLYPSPYEQLVNSSSSGSGSGSGTIGDVHRDPAVHAPAKSRGKTPRMVYDWEGKEELCYKLYITENKSLEEIMEFFKVTQDFTPRYVSCRVDSCPCYGVRSCML